MHTILATVRSEFPVPRPPSFPIAYEDRLIIVKSYPALTRVRSLASRVSIALLFAAPVAAQQRPRALDAFLTQTVGLDQSQLIALSRGEVVAKVLPTADGGDVSVLGVVHVSAPRAAFAQRQRDFHNALRAPTRSSAAVFSSPAKPADVAAIEVSSRDVDELRNCRPNDCNIKLPATDMDRLHATIDWTAPDARARVTAYVRQRLLEYVAGYRERGNAAMVVYDDQGGVRSSDALARMLADSTYVFSRVPSLGTHLLRYPADTLPDAAEVIFWSLDNLPHVRQVLRVTHEMVYSPPELPGTTVIAAKQIYADHYFEAGLELLTAIDDSAAANGPSSLGFTLLAVRHYRFDHLPSGGLLNLRGRVIGGLRDNVRADLVRLKRESESPT
jgi:hypothetical protein